MSEQQEKPEMSDQTRAVIAAALSLAVIIGWSLVYKPAQPPPSPSGAAQVTQSSVANAPSSAAATPAAPPSAPANVPAVAAAAEKTIVVQSDLYRVELSNRGAVARSWQLLKYKDEHDPPRTLDLVNTDAATQLGEWPLSLVFDQQSLEPQVNNALFQVTPDAQNQAVIQAPATVTFTWSDGHLEVIKRLKFDTSYIVNVETSVQLDGKPVKASLSWRGGFGDPTAVSRRGSLPVQVFYSSAGSLDTLAVAKLGQPKENTARATLGGPYEFSGVEDLYFAAAFLPQLAPAGHAPAPGLTLTDWAVERDTQGADGKVQKAFISDVAAGSSAAAGPLDVRIYVGPKSIDGLKAVQPPLNGLVQFGWFTLIAEPMFYALLWIHKYVPNYGWAILIFAVVLNAVLYPLRIKSTRAAQKMQKVTPEVKAIQEKYKKYSMRDPRKAEMNKEVMAVYSREGVNPLGGCWPQLIQFPIWYAVYRVLEYAIELRQAPWIAWIHDLSAPDPYYVIPIIVALAMYVTQRMTPTPGMDPAQARMMSFMPLVLGFLFIFYPSGLSLYILGSYGIGAVQQWHLNRTSPVKAPAKARKVPRTA